MHKLLIATHNQGKLRGYRRMLADLQPDIIETITYLETEGITLDVEETGETFVENARLKATSYAEYAGLLTWADDSGLEVDLLMSTPDGIWGIEIKSSRQLGASDWRSLQLVAESLGSQWRGGLVVYNGPELKPLAPNIWAMPVGRLLVTNS